MTIEISTLLSFRYRHDTQVKCQNKIRLVLVEYRKSWGYVKTEEGPEKGIKKENPGQKDLIKSVGPGFLMKVWSDDFEIIFQKRRKIQLS